MILVLMIHSLVAKVNTYFTHATERLPLPITPNIAVDESVASLL
jgi:hypothetical protein